MKIRDCAWGACLALLGCPSPAPIYRPVVYQPVPTMQVTPGTQPAPAPASARGEKRKLAVVPIEDDELFRSERAAIRQALHQRLGQVATAQSVLGLAHVDEKTSRSKCAYEEASPAGWARAEGWSATDAHIVYREDGNQVDLWIELGAEEVTFSGPWNRELPLFQRYLAAIAGLKELEGSRGVLGSIGVSLTFDGAASGGTLSACETFPNGNGCEARSSGWSDRLVEASACYADVDHAVDVLLIDNTQATPQCERVDLHDDRGKLGAREKCVCKAMIGSKALATDKRRRRVRIEHLAADLKGKTLPDVRALEVGTNVDSGHIWRNDTMRLEVANLDELAYPLARCAAGSGVGIAELTVEARGNVSAVRFLGKGQTEHACWKKALERGAFDCTSNGFQSTVVVSIAYP
jgi:hypothetical protein